ncbi:unnamed protein product [Ranitomeya imitator]|uniref:NADH dehydrogenase [ubiquinone] 1 alpha subcomplex subunit 11 n=1 Tax=Ranitomeya imitator TaxID=111125 RepID=A0ABN9KQR6_9NEOB|nr:unnamed protein product [Ranitomeya imitator]
MMSRSIHQRHVAPQTVQELAIALVQVWEEIPQETIRRLIRIMPRRCPSSPSACSGVSLWKNMGYWDIPDGTDCVQKTWLVTRLSVALGLVGSAYHIIAFKPKTALEGVLRAGEASITMAALGAIFGITTCVTAQVREKPDDLINYFVGGCASGAFLGIKYLILASTVPGNCHFLITFQTEERAIENTLISSYILLLLCGPPPFSEC